MAPTPTKKNRFLVLLIGIIGIVILPCIILDDYLRRKEKEYEEIYR